jgi:hypothetical protein
MLFLGEKEKNIYNFQIILYVLRLKVTVCSRYLKCLIHFTIEHNIFKILILENPLFDRLISTNITSIKAYT